MNDNSTQAAKLEVSRDDLYDQVWSKPMTHWAFWSLWAVRSNNCCLVSLRGESNPSRSDNALWDQADMGRYQRLHFVPRYDRVFWWDCGRKLVF